MVFMSSTYIVDDPQVHNLYGRPFARVLCIGTCTWYCSHALPTRMTKMPCLSNFTQVRKTRERLSVRRTIFRLSALSFATGEILRASVLTYQYTRYCISELQQQQCSFVCAQPHAHCCASTAEVHEQADGTTLL